MFEGSSCKEFGGDFTGLGFEFDSQSVILVFWATLMEICGQWGIGHSGVGIFSVWVVICCGLWGCFCGLMLVWVIQFYLFIYLFLLQIIIINKNKTSLETICENTCQTKF